MLKTIIKKQILKHSKKQWNIYKWKFIIKIYNTSL